MGTPSNERCISYLYLPVPCHQMLAKGKVQMSRSRGVDGSLANGHFYVFVDGCPRQAAATAAANNNITIVHALNQTHTKVTATRGDGTQTSRAQRTSPTIDTPCTLQSEM